MGMQAIITTRSQLITRTCVTDERELRDTAAINSDKKIKSLIIIILKQSGVKQIENIMSFLQP